jgi:hypothetical protein
MPVFLLAGFYTMHLPTIWVLHNASLPTGWVLHNPYLPTG